MTQTSNPQFQTPGTQAQPAQPTRQVPCDIEAEMSILGAMLIGGERVAEEAAGLLDATDFYRHKHEHIFVAMLSVVRKGSALDIVTLKDELIRIGILDNIGGMAYLMQIGDFVFTAANIEHYAAIVREKALARRIAEIGADLYQKSLSQQYTGPELKELMELHTYGVSTNASKFKSADGQQGRSGREVAADLLQEFMLSGNGPTGFHMDIPILDSITGGLHKAETTVIAARPGIGKSQMIMQAIYSLTSQGQYCMVFSVEMKDIELMKRFVLRLASVDSHQYREQGFHALNRDAQKRIVQSTQFVADLPIRWIDIRSFPKLHIGEIESMVRRQSMQHTVDAVFVDYAQRVRPDPMKKYGTRQEQVADVSTRLADIAVSMNVCMCVAAQINRQGSNEPTMSDLKESGQLEQDAHCIILLHEITRQDTTGNALIRAIVEKSRNGPTGKVELACDRRFGTFTTTPY